MALVPALVLLTSGCSAFVEYEEVGEPSGPAARALTASSEFSRERSYLGRVAVESAPGIDFVLHVVPSKATPLPEKWFPRGDKLFSFTFEAYDLDPSTGGGAGSGRLVYLSEVRVESSTVTADGTTGQPAYTLDTLAPRATFDPRPTTSRHGMLITAPESRFELRQQRIGTLSDDTIGVTMTFTFAVSVETAPGSGEFEQTEVRDDVVVGITPSDEVTAVDATVPAYAV